MSTSRPASAPEPGADQTVRLGPGQGGDERTVRLGPEETVRLDPPASAAPAGPDGTVVPGPAKAAPAAPAETVFLNTAKAAPVPADDERTVRLPSGPPAAERTVQLGSVKSVPGAAAPGGAGAAGTPGGAGGVEETVRLARAAEAAAAGEATVRLAPGAAAVPPAGPDAEETVRLADAEPMSATFLDPRVWGGAPEPGETLPAPVTPAYGTATPVPVPVTPAYGTAAGAVPPAATSSHLAGGPEASQDGTGQDGSGQDDAAGSDERPLAPGEVRRFGPGVPPQAAAVWHGAAAVQEPPVRRRRVKRWLVPVAVLLAVLAFLYWRFSSPALAVTGVGVSTDPAGPGCGGTAVVTAAVETNGGAGTIRYRWLRSDGTDSGEIVQDVRSGAHRTDLVLRWSFEGKGALQATATLQLLSPGERTAAASFTYNCP